MKKMFLILFGFITLTSMRGDMPAYEIYNSTGKTTDFEKLVREASEADVILFGEIHNNPICHWLQYELTRNLYILKKGNLILGAEMFENDNTLVISEYLAGKVKDKNFETEAKLWPNYRTDYKPLLEFARDSNLRFIATNIPRRYAALVNRQGFEGLDLLDADAKKLIAPLPIDYDPDLPGYKSMIEMMGENAGSHVNDNLPKAQAVKDATMAYFISLNTGIGKTFLHFHGTYHSDNYEGIVWYLRRLKPELKILTINSSEQDETGRLDKENEGIADFIIVTPTSMTKTH
ncbi:MAG: ChaN family lipoprotein [Bacteroidota bacterium]